MADKGWKQAERRMARDVGCERIPVTGERHGADFADGLCVYQLKVRKAIPGWLWDWLEGIRTGFLVLVRLAALEGVRLAGRQGERGPWLQLIRPCRLRGRRPSRPRRERDGTDVVR